MEERQYIYISNDAFQIVVSDGKDIENLKILDSRPFNPELSLLRNFEEFIYDNPSVLTLNRPTDVLVDFFPAPLLPGNAETKNTAALLDLAWPTSDSEVAWQVFPVKGIEDLDVALRLEKPLTRFMQRSFYPLAYHWALEGLIRRWHQEAKDDTLRRRPFSLHVQWDKDHIYMGLFKSNGRLIAAPAYYIAASPDNIKYYITKTADSLFDNPEDDLSVCLYGRQDDIEQVKPFLDNGGLHVFTPKLSYRSSFKTFVEDSRDINVCLKAYLCEI